MLSISALLDDPSLELRLLVAGRAGALHDEVAWVHITELPNPLPYLREHELVLTNGLWLDRTRPGEFVANVTRAGAAGIVFGLRVQLTTTPPSLIDACRSAEMPLLEISVDVPFTAVSRAAAAIYAEQRQSALVGMVRRGDALAAAISHGSGACGVLEVLRHDHDLPLVVVDRMGRLLAAAGGELEEDQLRAAADRLSARPPPLEIDLGVAGRAAVFPVGALSDVDAALLCLRPMTELNRVEQDALDQAARFLSLEVTRQQAVQAIEQRFASELLDMILSGAQRASEVPARLRAFGVDPDGPLTILAVAFGTPQPDAGTTEGVQAATLPGLAETITDFLVAGSLAGLVAEGSQDVVVVLSWRHSHDELSTVATRLAGSVGRRFPGRRAVVGLSEPAVGAAGLRQPLVQSREACRVLRRRREGTAVAMFAELGTYRSLLALHDGERLRGFAESVLGPLRAHDRLHGGELEATLRAFLDHDGHWAATAAALYVHVNTLRNRLTKIAELTGRDVGRTPDRVDLFLAMAADADQFG